MRRSDGMTPHIRELAEKLWSYHQLRHTLSKADVILVLCSHDRGVAEQGAELFLGGWAPLLVFSGGLGTITAPVDRARGGSIRHCRTDGCAETNILIENRSTNTGENVRLTRQLLAEHGLDPESFILVQKPWNVGVSRPSGKSGPRSGSL